MYPFAKLGPTARLIAIAGASFWTTLALTFTLIPIA